MSTQDNVTTPQFCDTCNQIVRLEKDTRTGTFLLKCACPIDEPIPRTWEYDEWS